MVAFIEEAETAIMRLDEGIRISESWDGELIDAESLCTYWHRATNASSS